MLVYATVHLTSDDLQGTGKTRLSLTSHPVGGDSRGSGGQPVEPLHRRPQAHRGLQLRRSQAEPTRDHWFTNISG